MKYNSLQESSDIEISDEDLERYEYVESIVADEYLHAILGRAMRRIRNHVDKRRCKR